MSDKQLIARENTILKIKSGSHLYGTNTETSDEDYVGIFMPDENMVFGFDNVKEVDSSIISKRSDGKNDIDAVDIKVYELRNFFYLFLKNNPNILEIPFVNEESIVEENKYGKIIRNNKHLFPYIGLYDSFIGYAFAQRKKMIIKKDNYFELKQFHDIISKLMERPENHKKLLVEFDLDMLTQVKSSRIDGQDTFKIGDISLQRHVRLSKVFNIIGDRLSRVTNRVGLFEKYGYDTKFASHLVRLLYEGKELLETGSLVFPLKESQLILDIKNGKYEMVDVIAMADDLETELRYAKEHSNLPKNPNYHAIQELSKEMLYDWFKLKG